MAAVKTSRSLRAYFVAQIVSTAATWFGELTSGLDSNLYRIVYAATTAAITVCAAAVAWQAGARLIWLTTVPAAAYFGFFVAYGHAKSVDFWIVLAEMIALLSVGFTIGFRFAATRERTYAVLSFSWLAYAVYDAHWLVNAHVPILEYLCPTYIVTVSCLWVAKENWRIANDTVRAS